MGHPTRCGLPREPTCQARQESGEGAHALLQPLHEKDDWCTGHVPGPDTSHKGVFRKAQLQQGGEWFRSYARWPRHGFVFYRSQ